jgi:hypothetical protein
MGIVHLPPKAILFTGLIYSISAHHQNIHKVLEEEFGSVCLTSRTFSFDETDYYRVEMGAELLREFISFDALISMESIPDIKLCTNRIEMELFSKNGRRFVNIDPGYLTHGKVILATTKNFQHRLYLGKGIYGEVTLRYRKTSFTPWEWTYKDYRRDESIEFFNKLRHIYRTKMKGFS